LTAIILQTACDVGVGLSRLLAVVALIVKTENGPMFRWPNDQVHPGSAGKIARLGCEVVVVWCCRY
jgi:hypothetical protein